MDSYSSAVFFYLNNRKQYPNRFFSCSLPQAHRHEVTICNYEAAANPADHKIESIIPQTNFIS